MRRKVLKADVARGLGVTRSRVSQLERQGMPTHSILAAKTWRDEHCDPDRMKPAPGTVAAEPDGERTRTWKDRLDKVRCLREERQLAVEAGDYLPAATVLQRWTKHMADLRQRLLAVPTRAAVRVRPESRRDEVLALVEEELYAAMNEISGNGEAR